jgi:hypothetical protein
MDGSRLELTDELLKMMEELQATPAVDLCHSFALPQPW